MHVHLPTGDWVCGCVGHYADSIERYFGSRPRAALGRGLRRALRAAGPVGVLLGWDASGKELDNAEIARICERVQRAVRRLRQRRPEPRGRAGAAGALPRAGAARAEAAPHDAGVRSGRRSLPAVLRRRGGARARSCSPTPARAASAPASPAGRACGSTSPARSCSTASPPATRGCRSCSPTSAGRGTSRPSRWRCTSPTSTSTSRAGSTATCPKRSSARSRAGCATSSASARTTRCSIPRPACPSSTGSNCPPDVAQRGPARQRRPPARPVMPDEAAVRERMRALAEAGDHAGALAEYAELELRLRAELELSPRARRSGCWTRSAARRRRRWCAAGAARRHRPAADASSAASSSVRTAANAERRRDKSDARRAVRPERRRALVGRPGRRPLLRLAAPALVIQPTSLAPAVGFVFVRGRGTCSASLQPLRQPLQRELAVARLRARVLRDRGHARAELRAYPRFLCLG